MIQPKIIAEGTFQPEDIQVTFSEQSKCRSSPEIERQIDELWKAMQADAATRGIRIWNGLTYRADTVSTGPNGKLTIAFSVIDYKTRECLLKIPGYYTMPEEYYRRGAYTGAFILTSDGYYLFMELSGKSNNTNRYDVIGGIIDDELPVRSGQDLYESFYKELTEEAAIPRDRIESCALRLVLLGSDTNVGFQFHVTLKDTKAAVEERFLQQADDPDVQALHFVEAAKAADFASTISINKTIMAQAILSAE